MSAASSVKPPVGHVEEAMPVERPLRELRFSPLNSSEPRRPGLDIRTRSRLTSLTTLTTAPPARIRRSTMNGDGR